MEKPEKVLDQIAHPPPQKDESLLGDTVDRTSLLITQQVSGKQQISESKADEGKKKKFSEFFKLKKEKKP